ncbi:MAG: HEAT repeat domain-containing protein [Planctomycetota bacterium]
MLCRTLTCAGFVLFFLVLLFGLPVWADDMPSAVDKPKTDERKEPGYNIEDKTDKLAARRPLVKATLKDGTSVEGLLERFADGQYMLTQNGRQHSFSELDVWQLKFVGPLSGPRSPLGRRIAHLAKPSSYKDVAEELKTLGAQAGPQFGELLDDSDPTIRRQAVESLWNLSCMSGTVIPRELEGPLIKALHDDDPRVRVKIPISLAVLGEKNDSVIVHLAEALNHDPDSQVAYVVQDAFMRMVAHRELGSPGLKAIIDAMAESLISHPRVHIRSRSAMLLGTLGEKGMGACDALIRASDDPDKSIRESAAKALRQVGYTLSVALQKQGTDEKVAKAIVVCAQTHYFVSQDVIARSVEAREVLKAAGPKHFADILIAIRFDDEQRYWQEFMPVISAWGEAIVPELKQLIQDKNPLVRRIVAQAFLDIPTTTIPETIRVLAKDEDASVRATAGMVLAQICGVRLWSAPPSRKASPEVVNEAVPLLVQMLNYDQVHNQMPLTHALASLAPDHLEIVPAMLKTMKQTKNEARRHLVMSTLGSSANKMRRAEDVAMLVDAFCDLIENDSSNATRISAIGYLGRMGARAELALPVLHKAENDPDPQVARNARDAVARISSSKTNDADRPKPKEQPRFPPIRSGPIRSD